MASSIFAALNENFLGLKKGCDGGGPIKLSLPTHSPPFPEDNLTKVISLLRIHLHESQSFQCLHLLVLLRGMPAHGVCSLREVGQKFQGLFTPLPVSM